MIETVLVNRCMCVFSHVQLFVAPWTVAHQGSLSVEFSRQVYWSGLPFPTPKDLPDPGIKTGSPESPAWASKFFTAEPPGKPHQLSTLCLIKNHSIKCRYSDVSFDE